MDNYEVSVAKLSSAWTVLGLVLPWTVLGLDNYIVKECLWARSPGSVFGVGKVRTRRYR